MKENLICHHKQCIFEQKGAKIVQKRIFPDTILPINDLKPLSPVSDQVIWNFNALFWRKWPKTLFLGKNGQFLDQKRVQKKPKKNCQNLKFIYPLKNIKIVQITKLDHKTSTDWKEMAKIAKKPILLPQAK